MSSGMLRRDISRRFIIIIIIYITSTLTGRRVIIMLTLVGRRRYRAVFRSHITFTQCSQG